MFDFASFEKPLFLSTCGGEVVELFGNESSVGLGVTCVSRSLNKKINKKL